jgi:hypothetical protein
MRRLTFATGAASIAALLAGTTLPAYADPLDPPAHGRQLYGSGHAQSAIDGQGGIHVARLGQLSEWAGSVALTTAYRPTDGAFKKTGAHDDEYADVGDISAGYGSYAVMAWKHNPAGGPVAEVRAKVKGTGGWGQAETLGTGSPAKIWVDTNLRGDAVVTWQAVGSGILQSAVRPRGGSWTSAATPASIEAGDLVAEPVMAEDGTAFVTWYDADTPAGGTVRRSRYLPNSGWNGTWDLISNPPGMPASLATAFDSNRRQTVAIGSHVYRQAGPSGRFTKQFSIAKAVRVSVDAWGQRTAVAWIADDRGRLNVGTRRWRDTWSPVARVWTKDMSGLPACARRALSVDTAISLEGRRYVTWSTGFERPCPTTPENTEVAAVDGHGKVLARRRLQAGEASFQDRLSVDVGARGPVAVTMSGWDDGASHDDGDYHLVFALTR